MNIFKLYKDSFSIVVMNPTVTLFLVMFLIVSNIFAGYLISVKSFLVAAILSFCIFMLGLCFASGWFNVIKDIACDSKAENKNYFAVFFEGIGKNIIPVGLGSFLYTLLLTLLFFLAGKFANHFFGSLDFILRDMATIAQDNKALMEYFNNLSVDQKYIVYSWNLCFVLVSLIYNFLLMFYFPALIFNEKTNNFLKPFVAFKDSICFLFKNFFGSLFVYICIYLTYMLLSVLKALFVANPLVSILLLLFYIYFISGAIMLVFNYYGQKYNCANGCDSIREDENIDKPCEND